MGGHNLLHPAFQAMTTVDRPWTRWRGALENYPRSNTEVIAPLDGAKTLNTPVALVIFNRPDLTARVFAEIAKVQPRRLFVIADGPRPARERDREQCEAARRAVERVDWTCEVVRDYAETNQGASDASRRV